MSAPAGTHPLLTHLQHLARRREATREHYRQAADVGHAAAAAARPPLDIPADPRQDEHP